MASTRGVRLAALCRGRFHACCPSSTMRCAGSISSKGMRGQVRMAREISRRGFLHTRWWQASRSPDRAAGRACASFAVLEDPRNATGLPGGIPKRQVRFRMDAVAKVTGQELLARLSCRRHARLAARTAEPRLFLYAARRPRAGWCRPLAARRRAPARPAGARREPPARRLVPPSKAMARRPVSTAMSSSCRRARRRGFSASLWRFSFIVTLPLRGRQAAGPLRSSRRHMGRSHGSQHAAELRCRPFRAHRWGAPGDGRLLAVRGRCGSPRRIQRQRRRGRSRIARAMQGARAVGGRRNRTRIAAAGDDALVLAATPSLAIGRSSAMEADNGNAWYDPTSTLSSP